MNEMRVGSNVGMAMIEETEVLGQ